MVGQVEKEGFGVGQVSAFIVPFLACITTKYVMSLCLNNMQRIRLSIYLLMKDLSGKAILTSLINKFEALEFTTVLLENRFKKLKV